MTIQEKINYLDDYTAKVWPVYGEGDKAWFLIAEFLPKHLRVRKIISKKDYDKLISIKSKCYFIVFGSQDILLINLLYKICKNE